MMQIERNKNGDITAFRAGDGLKFDTLKDCKEYEKDKLRRMILYRNSKQIILRAESNDELNFLRAYIEDNKIIYKVLVEKPLFFPVFLYGKLENNEYNLIDCDECLKELKNEYNLIKSTVKVEGYDEI